MRVMCSGRIEPSLVLEAFACGIDGVLIGACHPGDCHYVRGNCMAAFRVSLLHTTMDQLGIDRKRLELVWISASEGCRFAASLRELEGRLVALGPIRSAPLCALPPAPPPHPFGGDR
jgi:F420-non-reducing hydrogenase iron-sulfur subunit